MTSSDSVSKIISCCFSCFVSDFFYYQYWHLPYVFQRKSTVFPSSCFWPLSLRASNVAFECRSFLQAVLPFLLKSSSLLSTFLKGSSLAALPLRTKDVDIPYFVQNFLLALLAYMESAATHLTLTFISFCCIRIDSPSSVYPH